LTSGVDISLWDKGFTGLEEAIKKGFLQGTFLDQAVMRVLELKFAQGLFENPYLEEKEPSCFRVEEYPETLELARQSAVLLKNDGLLPLDINKIKSIAVIGPNADNIYNQLGDYTPPLRDGEGITLLDGLNKLCPNDVLVKYAEGCSVCGMDESAIDESAELASTCDVVILALGGSSSRFSGAKFDVNGAALAEEFLQMDCGEGVDSSELALPGVQQKLAQAVFAVGKPVVTVLIQGRPYAVEEEAGLSNALLCAFYPGPMGGQAIAEILLGKVSPSGCLPVSIPRSVGQLPVYYNYKTSYEAMKYRNMPDKPLFPFGFGLSYTSFEITNVKLGKGMITLSELEQGARAEVLFNVKNVGNYKGHAVMQLYIQDLQASTVRRVRELKSFRKVDLEPGNEKNCILTIGYEELAIWDSSMRFCVEPGNFMLELRESGKVIWSGKLTVE
jgi:beta-glucosidase